MKPQLESIAHNPILPAELITILGGGQLGSMLCEAAKRMGYRTFCVSSHETDPARRWADHHLIADPGEPATAARVARQSAVVTVEAESIDPAALEAAANASCRVAPSADVQRTVRDRRLEKLFLRDHGLAVGPFAIAESAKQMSEAAETLFAAGAKKIVAKTARGGYDGKGQRWQHSIEESADAWEALGSTPLVLEAGIDFVAEASVIVARSADGRMTHFPVFQNEHRRGILFQTRMPGDFPPATVAKAIELGRSTAEALGVVGLLAVEMFILPDGDVFINELAARPHNSGHVTMRAASRSQFEMHIAAICGLPLPEIHTLQPGVMTNLLGDLWAHGEPDFPKVLADGRGMIHLYGKSPRAGRKMGHMIHTAPTLAEAVQAANAAFALLQHR
ncbi:MAG: 5-(carboxyamino)imidazole ribonucleotide synthase [Phycisphaerae bacterium]